ncbi:hypothetical protein [Vibrio paucivorans]|uniref:Uncharacterized protein n=1 Tax=Vibrio paucivorans TaxID=2829489 RepID=A0A9X3CIM3_9VIBR|nr:hypothetical protein [Vibrio paucivorans]MCW8336573.1 hypothetical protein [Vibrio paucivorans]
MAKKGKGQSRALKARKRRQKKTTSTNPASKQGWTSDEARDAGMTIFRQLQAVDSISCFNIERPEVGKCYRSSHSLEDSFTVLDCSERDIMSGDFWVVGDTHNGERRVLSSREWECERIMLTNLTLYTPST